MRVVVAIGMACLGGAAFLGGAVHSPNPDEALVRQAVLDYVEACYSVQPERIEQSVDPSLMKSGFFRGKADTDTGPVRR